MEFVEYTEVEMKKTADEFDGDSELPSNYIHAYMKAARDRQGETFTDKQLLAVVFDLFIAGTETTSTTLRHAILLLASHPEVQEKLYEEIKDQIGTDSLPSYADRTKLPFAEAVITEILRFANLTPFGVPRRALKPTQLMGYDIPRDAIVIAFLTNVLHNPDYFADPFKFDPHRFLDSNGKVVRDPKLIPFLAGKRICLGEPLARMELFLMLMGLVGRFRFYFALGQKKPSLKPVVGLLSAPEPYRIYVEARSG